MEREPKGGEGVIMKNGRILKAAIYSIAAVGVVALALGIYYLLWLLWTWVMPQMWAAGPDNFVRPSYCLFVVALVLLLLVGKAIFGGSK